MKNKKDSLAVAREIAKVIGVDNVDAYTNCMTRLRITLKPGTVIDDKEIKSIEHVMGLMKTDTQYQIILGPGFVNRVTEDFGKLVTVQKGATIEENLDIKKPNEKNLKGDNELQGQLFEISNSTKMHFRSKTKTVVLNFFNKISQIFTPFVPVFIAAGIFQAVGSIILTAVGADNLTGIANSWINFFTVSLTITMQILCVIIGYQTSKVFGGSPLIGAMLAAMYTPAFGAIIGGLIQPDGEEWTFLGMHISNLDKNWFTVGIFRDGKASGLTGSMFGAIGAAALATLLEKQTNKILPDSFKLICTPLIVVFTMLLVQFFLLVPVTGYTFKGMAWFFAQVTTNKWVTPWLGAFLAGIWLWLVVFGVHQGATPVYLMLLETMGMNTLFPIVAMAGAAQVGTALALYFRAEKGAKIRKQISGALVPGVLGIGEPLIYGVTLPRMKPFITSCLGAAIGGLFIGLIPLFGIQIGTNAMGPSGLLALPLMTSSGASWIGMVLYLSGLGITYGSGFLFTYFFGWKGVDLK